MPEAATITGLGVKADFPIFAQRFDERGGRALIYLDSGATSQKPEAVIEAVANHLREHNANVHRGVYALAQEADAAYDGARGRVAAFVGAQPETTIFTKNVTEAINLVAYSWGRANVGSGDAVLITQMEHHANIVPWQVLCRERGAELRYLEVDARGEISLDQLDEELARGDVRMVAVTHVSNVLGTILPVAEIVARARAAGAATLVDGAQAVPHMPVDVAAVGADFYAWTGHKALGPTGIGVLHGRREVLEAMEPFLTGGDMIASVDFQGATWNELPYKFEAGTPPIAEAVGLGAAVDYLSAIGMDRVRAHERALTAYMLERLGDVPGLRVTGPPEADARGGLASFTIEGMHPHDIAELADRGGVCIRAGHHCAQPLMRCLGVSATARASIGVYNEPADIDALVAALLAGREVFGL
jgi:cysteine desulfurase / selenocysteine lyase